MDKTTIILWLASLLILVLPVVSQSEDQQDFLDLEDDDDLSPIQILKKGQSIMIHPRNCPGGFRKRDSSRTYTIGNRNPTSEEFPSIPDKYFTIALTMKTENSLSESILPLKNDFMKSVQHMLRNYIERRQNAAAQGAIFVDYIPRRILFTGRQGNERR